MKKYYFEADRKQWEKSSQPKYMFCATAKTWAIAETEEAARAIALKKLEASYYETGILLDDLQLTNVADLPTDWNYGYGESRGTGTPEERAALRQECTK